MPHIVPHASISHPLLLAPCDILHRNTFFTPPSEATPTSRILTHPSHLCLRFVIVDCTPTPHWLHLFLLAQQRLLLLPILLHFPLFRSHRLRPRFLLHLKQTRDSGVRKAIRKRHHLNSSSSSLPKSPSSTFCCELRAQQPTTDGHRRCDDTCMPGEC